jgi:hypothetical protein
MMLLMLLMLFNDGDIVTGDVNDSISGDVGDFAVVNDAVDVVSSMPMILVMLRLFLMSFL